MIYNDNWQFFEFALNKDEMEQDGKALLAKPAQFFAKANAQNAKFKDINLPHDWMISDTENLYRNSVGCYKKTFTLDELNLGADALNNKNVRIRFDGVYMNSAVFVNGVQVGEWKYGYTPFEFDITKALVQGTNTILVLAVYQNLNSRWYSGAGIFRNVHLLISDNTYLATNGTYFVSKKIANTNNYELFFSADVASLIDDVANAGAQIDNVASTYTVQSVISNKDSTVIAKTEHFPLLQIDSNEENQLKQNLPSLANKKIFRASCNLVIQKPTEWEPDAPNLYVATTTLYKNGVAVDNKTERIGFKDAIFDCNKGFLLNGKALKLHGACQHHDFGALGSAFCLDALKRQFFVLKEMGVNAIRCSHNPQAPEFMSLADEMGFLVISESFDMWEKPKTTYDYGNYFNDWYKKDVAEWIRQDRNHACLLMWSIGNEIYDTHSGNGYAITKNLVQEVALHDAKKVAPVTLASNYMMSESAQKCAELVDVVGYNYLERIYDEHHQKYPHWKIYGSETASTIQSRGVYHFPLAQTLVTYEDVQCSSLGNCTTTWGAVNTQSILTEDRDTPFSAGQFIWTGWDYIGEPTPYQTKNSYFGQIDTAGFKKDTFYLYKALWQDPAKESFVHILPYWDFNPGQLIDVKIYSNVSTIKVLVNGKEFNTYTIDLTHGNEPFVSFSLPYQTGEIRALAYNANGELVAQDVKQSFGDATNIVLKKEEYETGDLHFIDVFLQDANGVEVANARNYITLAVDGNAKLLALDNGDSTDYEQYQCKDGKTHTRKLFNNRLLAIVKSSGNYTITAASKDLCQTSMRYSDGSFTKVSAPALTPAKNIVPIRNVRLVAKGSTALTKQNPFVLVDCMVYPANATFDDIKFCAVLDECVSSDYIEIEQISKTSLRIKGVQDGKCRLRCTASNGKNYGEIISDLEFSVSGMGSAKLDPYKLIEGCRFSLYNSAKQKPPVSLLGGFSNRVIGATWVAFEKVDFGLDGADEIHVPIFSFDTSLPIKIWDGTPENGECILDATYEAQWVYNVYTERVFKTTKRLFGVHTIAMEFATELVCHGFYFTKSQKAFARLNALDATTITGDTFTRTKDAVTNIGNNVALDFSHMDFSSTVDDNNGAGSNCCKNFSLTICGKSNSDNNTIHVKCKGDDGSSKTIVLDFAHTDEYVEKTFTIEEITGKNTISFVFLPGSNFDFKWFKFTR